MKSKSAIMNCNSIFMILSLQDDINHITCKVGETSARIDIYEGYHSRNLYKIKRAIMPGCMDGTIFKFRHYEKDDEAEAFSVLIIEWNF